MPPVERIRVLESCCAIQRNGRMVYFVQDIGVGFNMACGQASHAFPSDGFEVLRCIRVGERTRLLPAVPTSSIERRHVVKSYHLCPNSFVRKSVAFDDFAVAVPQKDLHWLVLNCPRQSGGH